MLVLPVSAASGLLERLAELLHSTWHRKIKHFELLITSQLETLNINWLTNQQKKEETEFSGLLSLLLIRQPGVISVQISFYNSISF